MRYIFKVMNSLLWFLNLISYFAHLESQRGVIDYQPYDFSKDLKYF